MAISYCRDSISSLPDEILGKISSLVPTKVAASTSVLSKRWRNLLGLVDTLCFDDSMVVYPNEEEATSGAHRFTDFVDKTLALLSNSPTKKFSPSIGNIHENDINRLLEIYLFSVLFDHPNYSRLICGSPVLEELHIRNGDHPIELPGCNIFVESAAIKRLVVFTNFLNYQDFHQQVYCQAPSLVYLDYSSYVSESYQFDDLDLLVEAMLSLRLWESTKDYDYSDDDDIDGCYSDNEPKAPIFGDVTDLRAGITNITTLHLSPDVEAMCACWLPSPDCTGA